MYMYPMPPAPTIIARPIIVALAVMAAVSMTLGNLVAVVSAGDQRRWRFERVFAGAATSS